MHRSQTLYGYLFTFPLIIGIFVSILSKWKYSCARKLISTLSRTKISTKNHFLPHWKIYENSTIETITRCRRNRVFTCPGIGNIFFIVSIAFWLRYPHFIIYENYDREPRKLRRTMSMNLSISQMRAGSVSRFYRNVASHCNLQAVTGGATTRTLSEAFSRTLSRDRDLLAE